jgi:hypothetical protein
MQALFTLHELLTTLRDTPIAKHIVIEPDPKNSPPTVDHVIKIKHNLDDDIIKKIEPIVKKRNLEIAKLSDAVVIR